MTGAAELKVSIVTVVLNGEHLIGDTVRSVAQQTYPHVEHVIKDGGSSDNTVAVARQWMDGRGILASRSDAGIYDAMNQGVDLCTGDLILFLNAGDVLFSEASLEQFVRRHYRGLDRIYLFAVATKDRGVRRPRWVWLKKHYMLPACHQGIIYPASVFDKDRYRTDYKIGGDYQHFLRVERGKILDSVDMVLSTFDDTGISTLNKGLMNSEFRRIYREMGVNPLFRMLKRAHEIHEKVRALRMTLRA